jgi:hypothetical protein
MSMLPIVSIKVQNGTSVVTLSTMGDTTHVQTDTGVCFHVRQLAEDSVYFKPARTILNQARQLDRTEHEMSQSFKSVLRARHSIQSLLKDGVDAPSHADADRIVNDAFDTLAKLEVLRIEVMRDRDELHQDIKAQNFSSRIANGDGTSTEILEY